MSVLRHFAYQNGLESVFSIDLTYITNLRVGNSLVRSKFTNYVHRTIAKHSYSTPYIQPEPTVLGRCDAEWTALPGSYASHEGFKVRIYFVESMLACFIYITSE